MGAPEQGKIAAFTLLEVLVSLAMFAAAAIVLASAYVNVLNSYAIVSRDSNDDQDVACARQGLLSQAVLEYAQHGDQFDTSDRRHVAWSAQAEPTDTADLFSVTFTCVITSSSSDVEPKTVKQSFMLLRPTWSQPADQAKLRQQAASRIAKLQGKTS